MAKKQKRSKGQTKIIDIQDRSFEVIGENRFTTRVFEAIAARSSTIMEALDKARMASLSGEEIEKPFYKHTILLGRDEEGRNLRASIAVFPNSVVVQTLREM
ncbi:MAG: hypothetical protein DRO95_01800 [Candidatus Altiarchaeales archaeon]|nr:MAG: hypothetical protein DRO95_01800 [Candidatus Altiarchaeales archaeon]